MKLLFFVFEKFLGWDRKLAMVHNYTIALEGKLYKCCQGDIFQKCNFLRLHPGHLSLPVVYHTYIELFLDILFLLN